ncbi:hypothetical protein LSH36_61g09061 [Paralvinella palmiformis]|uniref:Uncharacterized protein n=1 Tax=Paralvinella palmiformis TaxID=53620 RepID=A0AAD9K4D2_9ANNE|nr:hypothetical protein LSH36_61g09061 [Paralvinella palmiformis]
MMAVRFGMYKAHYWTWVNSEHSFHVQGIDYCPGQNVVNVTTHVQVNHTNQPLLFHLGRDPGEKYTIRPHNSEYQRVMAEIQKIVNDHKTHLKPGQPQLNYCDRAVMNWAPPGCEKLNKCLPIPPSHPKLCLWDH